MLKFFSLDEAAATEDAGIDIASVPAYVLFHPEYRGANDLFNGRANPYGMRFA